MAETTKTSETTETTEPKQKNIVERLADVGEGAIQRLGSAPGSDKVVSTLSGMRDRLDDLQRRAIRGMEDMQKRITALEERVDRLEGKQPAAPTESATPAATKPSTKSGSTSPAGGTSSSSGSSPSGGTA